MFSGESQFCVPIKPDGFEMQVSCCLASSRFNALDSTMNTQFIQWKTFFWHIGNLMQRTNRSHKRHTESMNYHWLANYQHFSASSNSNWVNLSYFNRCESDLNRSILIIELVDTVDGWSISNEISVAVLLWITTR